MNSDSQTLGEILKDKRMADKISQKDLGQKINVSRQVISSIETGSYTGTVKSLNAYANYYGLELTVRLRKPDYPQLDDLASFFMEDE